MIKYFQTCMLYIQITFLASCVSNQALKPPHNENFSIETRASKAKIVSSWSLLGALAVRNTNDSVTANISWQQNGTHQYKIRLYGPLGSGSVLITKARNTITLKSAEKTITSNDASQLFREQTGISLPVEKLYYWIRGIPAPGAIQAKRYDRYKHLTLLKQDNFTVNYLRYSAIGALDLPSKISITGNGLTIKLIIKRWNILS